MRVSSDNSYTIGSDEFVCINASVDMCAAFCCGYKQRLAVRSKNSVIKVYAASAKGKCVLTNVYGTNAYAVINYGVNILKLNVRIKSQA